MLFNYGQPHPAPGAAAPAAPSMWLRSALLSFPAPPAGRSRQHPLEARSPCSPSSSGPRARLRSPGAGGGRRGPRTWGRRGRGSPPSSPAAHAWNSSLSSLQVLLGLFSWLFCISGRVLVSPSASALPHACKEQPPTPAPEFPAAFSVGAPQTLGALCPFQEWGPKVVVCLGSFPKGCEAA